MDVTQILNHQFECSHCHAAGFWTRMAKSMVRQNSIIHRLQCSRCGARIVAKVSRGVNSCGDAYAHLREEYEILRMLQSTFPQDEHYGTLEPLGYLEFAGRGVVITRLFAGRDLARHLRRLDLAGVQETCHEAGAWLHKLHTSVAPSVLRRTLGVEDKINYLTGTYGTVLRKEDAKTRMACELLTREASRIYEQEMPAVQLHGDFKPENMLCDGVRYIGLDTHLESVGAAVYDFAPFLNHLWLGGHIGGSSRTRFHYDIVETAFLSGYGRAGETRILRWVQLYFALRYLGGYRSRGRLAASYANWKVRPLVVELTRRLQGVA